MELPNTKINNKSNIELVLLLLNDDKYYQDIIDNKELFEIINNKMKKYIYDKYKLNNYGQLTDNLTKGWNWLEIAKELIYKRKMKIIEFGYFNYNQAKVYQAINWINNLIKEKKYSVACLLTIMFRDLRQEILSQVITQSLLDEDYKFIDMLGCINIIGGYENINKGIIRSNNFKLIKYLARDPKYINIMSKMDVTEATACLDEEIMHYLCENKIIYVPDKIYYIVRALIDTGRKNKISDYLKYILEYSLQNDIDKVTKLTFIDVFIGKLKQLSKIEHENKLNYKYGNGEKWTDKYNDIWQENFGDCTKYDLSGNQKHKLYKLTYKYMAVMNKADATIDSKLDYTCIKYLIELYKITNQITNINTDVLVDELLRQDISYMTKQDIDIMIKFLKTVNMSKFELSFDKIIWLYDNDVDIDDNINKDNKDELFEYAVRTSKEELSIIVYNKHMDNKPKITNEMLVTIYQTMPELALFLSRCEVLARKFTFHTHMDLASKYGRFNIVQEILRDEPFSINYYESLLNTAVKSNDQPWIDNILTMQELIF